MHRAQVDRLAGRREVTVGLEDPLVAVEVEVPGHQVEIGQQLGAQQDGREHGPLGLGTVGTLTLRSLAHLPLTLRPEKAPTGRGNLRRAPAPLLRAGADCK